MFSFWGRQKIPAGTAYGPSSVQSLEQVNWCMVVTDWQKFMFQTEVKIKILKIIF